MSFGNNLSSRFHSLMGEFIRCDVGAISFEYRTNTILGVDRMMFPQNVKN